MKYISGQDILDIDDEATEVTVLISSVNKWITKTRDKITRLQNNFFSSF